MKLPRQSACALDEIESGDLFAGDDEVDRIYGAD